MLKIDKYKAFYYITKNISNIYYNNNKYESYYHEDDVIYIPYDDTQLFDDNNPKFNCILYTNDGNHRYELCWVFLDTQVELKIVNTTTQKYAIRIFHYNEEEDRLIIVLKYKLNDVIDALMEDILKMIN